MERHTIFISDLHLSNDTSENTRLFFNLLEENIDKIDAIYILGDLFQFWAGDDDHSIFNEKMRTTLKKASNKVPIYLMPGNRDFLLGETFAKESGCILISDPQVISLYGKRTVLTHGDILFTKDIKYRSFRKLIRFPYGVKMFLKLPLAFRLWFASKIQKYSAKMKSTKNKGLLAAQTEEAKKMLDRFNSDLIIHGHIHVEETEELTLGTQKRWRISLGDWDNQCSILVYHPDHTFEFKTQTSLRKFYVLPTSKKMWGSIRT
jgi:UDP-2,3-diacylglucosamine hydrolase